MLLRFSSNATKPSAIPVVTGHINSQQTFHIRSGIAGGHCAGTSRRRSFGQRDSTDRRRRRQGRRQEAFLLETWRRCCDDDRRLEVKFLGLPDANGKVRSQKRRPRRARAHARRVRAPLRYFFSVLNVTSEPYPVARGARLSVRPDGAATPRAPSPSAARQPCRRSRARPGEPRTDRGSDLATGSHWGRGSEVTKFALGPAPTPPGSGPYRAA